MDREDVDVEKVKDLVVKGSETMSIGRTDCQLGSNGVSELYQCFTLDDPVAAWDLPDHWDELTGKALDLEKGCDGVAEGVAAVQRERSVGACTSRRGDAGPRWQVCQDEVGPICQGCRGAMQVGGRGLFFG